MPREVWWDNPRTVATLILKGRERQVHPRYAALASHHLFEPKFCMPARGNVICDELGYVSMSRGGVELLFRVFADRYERGSVLVTTNLPFSEWGQIFQGERMTAALLDRLCHHCHIFEMNGESYRFRESMKTKKSRKAE